MKKILAALAIVLCLVVCAGAEPIDFYQLFPDFPRNNYYISITRIASVGTNHGMGRVDIPQNLPEQPNGQIYRIWNRHTNEVCYVSIFGNQITSTSCFYSPNADKQNRYIPDF